MRGDHANSQSGLGMGMGFKLCLSSLPELRKAEVDIDRNYDNYDKCELRYRNFDNAISIGCR